MTLHQADCENIIIPEERVRKEFDKRKLNNLAFSIQRIGQCQPGVCVPGENGRFILVAGERRLKACRVARLPFSFILREDADEETLLEIEVEENVNRVDLTWLEQVRATERLHFLREKQREQRGQKQGVRQTAEEVGDSVGKTHEDLLLAKWAKDIPEIASAKSKTEAKKIVKRYESEVVRNVMLTRATEEASESKARVAEAPEKGAPKTIEVGGKKLDNEWILDCDRRVVQGSFEEKIEEFKDGSIHLVIFDPPWGVGRETETNSQEHIDDLPDLFLDNAQGWLQILHRKMAEASHLYMFFGIIHYGVVYQALEDCGFEVDRIPLIWYKQGTHHQHNPSKWPGRSYEPIAFAHKGNKKLLTLGSPDVIVTKGPTPSMKQSHPHAKHPDVYVELLKRSAYPGETVLDPMAGSGMFGVACETWREAKRLDWWMVEKEPAFRTLALSNVIKGYYDVCNREPVLKVDTSWTDSHPVGDDFRLLKPGTDEWRRYWQEHPEEQEEMLRWKMETDSQNTRS